MFKKLLELLTPQTSSQRLVDETIRTITVQVPVKNTHYHEIVGDVVRIYHRDEGLVEEVLDCDDPHAFAVKLLDKYNGGK